MAVAHIFQIASVHKKKGRSSQERELMNVSKAHSACVKTIDAGIYVLNIKQVIHSDVCSFSFDFVLLCNVT